MEAGSQSNRSGFYFYFIALPVGFIKFAFKLMAIYHCDIALNCSNKIVYFRFKLYFSMSQYQLAPAAPCGWKSVHLLRVRKGLQSWASDIHIYYEIFQVLLTKDGVKKNYSTVGFINFSRGKLNVLPNAVETKQKLCVIKTKEVKCWSLSIKSPISDL